MKLDDVTKEIIVEIQNDLAKDDIDISIQEIANIVESQFIGGNLAFKKGLEVRLPLFGSFVRKHGLEKSKAAAELNKMKDMFTKEDFERKVLEAKLANKEKTKVRKSNIVRLNLSALKDAPNLVEVKNRYDKIL